MTDDECCTNNIDYGRTFSRLPFNRGERVMSFYLLCCATDRRCNGGAQGSNPGVYVFCILGEGRPTSVGEKGGGKK